MARHADGRRKLDGASRGGAGPGILRIEAFRYEITVDADAVTLSPGGTAVLSGALRNTCGKPWPEGTGGEPLQLGARLFRQSVEERGGARIPCVLGATAGNRGGRGRLPHGVRSRRTGARRLRTQHRCLKEDQFWLAEKGTGPRVIPVVIA